MPVFLFDKLKVTIYSYYMTAQEKLFQKARNNPDGLSFKDFQTLMSRAGWVNKRQKGSHEIWYSPKGYQVKQFLKLLTEETEQVEGNEL